MTAGQGVILESANVLASNSDGTVVVPANADAANKDEMREVIEIFFMNKILEARGNLSS